MEELTIQKESMELARYFKEKVMHPTDTIIIMSKCIELYSRASKTIPFPPYNNEKEE